MKVRILLAVACTVTAAIVPQAALSTRASASTVPCVDQPSNGNCNGQYPGQSDGTYSCFDDAYVVPYDNGDFVEYDTNGWEFIVTLWYSPRCQSNWAQVSADGQSSSSGITYSTKVRRYAGQDGSYLLEHGGEGVYYGQPFSWGPDAYSPMVYSPHNLAQACLSLPPYSGTPDQIACTQEW
jgi:hypothetical protein